jgi:hypothetical protein
MLRSILKYCIPIYLLLGCITIVVIRQFDNFLAFLLVSWILIAIIIAVGLFFGMIISVVIRKPNHEPKFYWIGQLVSLTLIAPTFIHTVVDGRRTRSNAEENEITIRNVTDSISGPFVHRAFDSLKLKFKSPNDLDLNSVTEIENRDGFTVYFAYNLFGKHDKEYYSKYRVKTDQAQLVQFNLDTRSTIDYLHVHKLQESLKDTLKKYENMAK